MAEAAATDKGLSMEEKVREMLPLPAQHPSGLLSLPWICQGIYKQDTPRTSPCSVWCLVLSPSGAGGGRGSCSLCLGGLFYLPLDRCRCEERAEGEAAPRSHPGSECFPSNSFPSLFKLLLFHVSPPAVTSPILL